MAVETEQSLISSIFDGVDAEYEAALPQAGDPPLGTFDVELLDNITWAYGISRKNGTEYTRVEMHFVVREVVKLANEKVKVNPGRTFYVSEFIDGSERSKATLRNIGQALGLEPVEGSFIRAMYPTYAPNENPLDGGIVEDTAGLSCRIRIWQGDSRRDADTDAVLPGYFNYRYSAIAPAAD